MNFFAHSYVASWYSDSPAVGLGAMLPDFASMLGLKRASSTNPDVALGIALHHRTDAIFHQTRAFLELQRDARSYLLSSAAISRGARRAVAHIGPELILDAELSRDEQARAYYVAALKPSSTWTPKLFFQADEVEHSRARFESLRHALLERAARPTPEGPATLGHRLRRILEGRPLLSLSHEAQAGVERWAEGAWPKVTAELEPLLAELRSKLDSSQIVEDLRRRRSTLGLGGTSVTESIPEEP